MKEATIEGTAGDGSRRYVVVSTDDHAGPSPAEHLRQYCPRQCLDAFDEYCRRGNLLWGADYPHSEGTWPDTRVSLRHTFAGIPETEVRAILGETAIEVYHLDRAALCAIADRIGPRPEEIAVPVLPEEIPEGRNWAFSANTATSADLAQQGDQGGTRARLHRHFYRTGALSARGRCRTAHRAPALRELQLEPL